MKIAAAVIVLSLVAGVGVYVNREAQSEQKQRDDKRQLCLDLVATLSIQYPDTPYDKLPLLRQIQVKDACGLALQ